MEMLFLGFNLDGVSSGTAPTEAGELKVWEKLDKQAIFWIYSTIADEYRYLIKGQKSARAAWKILSAHFQRSTLAHRMAARSEFYAITHDPSRPIDFYIQALQAARAKMTALGCKIEDMEFKDVLLMHLDPSFHAVRTNILAVATEPELDDVKRILTSSSDIAIKIEPVDIAMAARSDRFRGDRSSTRSGRNPLIDDDGFRWCDQDSRGCHRCGRKGHPALKCMLTMPQQVKDYLMNSRSRSRSQSQHHSKSHPRSRSRSHSPSSSSRRRNRNAAHSTEEDIHETADSARTWRRSSSYSPHPLDCRSYSPSDDPSLGPLLI